MGREKEKEENQAALKRSRMYQYEVSKTTLGKEQRKIDYSDQYQHRYNNNTNHNNNTNINIDIIIIPTTTTTTKIIEKTMEHESDNHTNCKWCFWCNHQTIIKLAEGFGDKRTSVDNPNYYIIENGQNTEKSPVDLRRLAVSQTPVKDPILTLMWKTLKE